MLNSFVKNFSQVDKKVALSVGVGVSAALGLLYTGKKYFSGGVCKTTHLLKDKNILVTGGNTGLGKSTCIEIAKAGASNIFIACRNSKLGLKAAKEIAQYNDKTNVEFVELDLADLESVRKSVDTLKSKNIVFDVLINNAGVMRTPYLKTKQGHELQVGVNHIGHFYFTNLLLENNLINPNGGRIVNVSSLAHRSTSEINEKNLNCDRENYNRMTQYGLSKMCNILFAQELQRRLNEQGKNILCFSLHPGVCRTELARHEGFLFDAICLILYPLYWYFTKSSVEGSQTTLHCASHPDLEKYAGKYFADCDVARTHIEAKPEDAKYLWEYSENFIKKFEESNQ